MAKKKKKRPTKKGNIGAQLQKKLVKSRMSGGYKGPTHSTMSTKEFEKLSSVTEQTDVEALFNKAEMAGREYVAERGTRIVQVSDITVTLAKKSSQEHFEKMLDIPKRPKWDVSMSSERLVAVEKDSFVEWRRGLAETEELNLVTPFEKNIEIWRQLWRVVEFSDIVVQIIDARNPLLFRCQSLENYVRSFEGKKVVILMNKADLVDESSIEAWKEFFRDSIEVIFFSAVEHSSLLGDDVKLPSELIDELMRIGSDIPGIENRKLNVGMTGYPNVGKSSVINTLLDFVDGESGISNKNRINRRVAVSSTPGKTKHFQTHVLTEKIMIYDCPGLVFPSVVASKAEMICNGILSVDTMTNYRDPVSYVCINVPNEQLEELYSISLGRGGVNMADEICGEYAKTRGFMRDHGRTDESRAARYILKDFVGVRNE